MGSREEAICLGESSFYIQKLKTIGVQNFQYICRIRTRFMLSICKSKDFSHTFIIYLFVLFALFFFLLNSKNIFTYFLKFFFNIFI
ncbi:hypothetical protein FKM82_009227 [Ascaphus truei]